MGKVELEMEKTHVSKSKVTIEWEDMEAHGE